jgi:hypothetical protein
MTRADLDTKARLDVVSSQLQRVTPEEALFYGSVDGLVVSRIGCEISHSFGLSRL